MTRARAWAAVAGCCALGGSTAHAADPIDDVAWARVVDPVVTVQGAAVIEVDRRGDVVRFSGGELPALPATDGPVPVLLYLAMDGVTVLPDCPGTLPYHSALDCTRIADAPTTIEAMVGGSLRAAFVQNVESLLADFDVVVTTQRPPDWVPYVMVVVGGDGTWYEDNLCGVGSLACGAPTRNVISFAFPGNGNCFDPSATVGHELGHNLGLEHTSLEPDLMYPSNGHVRTPQDACSTLVTEPDDPVSCGFSHAEVCTQQGGTAQNTYGELMLRVGPRRNDTSPPEIVSVYPGHGSSFTTEDTIVVGAQLQEDSGLLAVRWRWQQGAPPELGAYSRCTNGVCDHAFAAGNQASGEYDFVTLDQPPAGDYGFVLEATDVYGNGVEQWVQFRVDEPAPAQPDDTGSTGDDGVDTEDPAQPMTGTDTGTLDEPLPPDYGLAAGDAGGCACASASTRVPYASAWLLWAFACRRRRSAQKQEGGSSYEEPPSTRPDSTVVERADRR